MYANVPTRPVMKKRSAEYARRFTQVANPKSKSFNLPFAAKPIFCGFMSKICDYEIGLLDWLLMHVC